MVVAVLELDLELDPGGRTSDGGLKDDAIEARLEPLGEPSDFAAVGVGPAAVATNVLAASRPRPRHPGGRPARHRCRGRRGSRARISYGSESFRLDTMVAHDLGLVGADERPAAHDVAPCDDEPVDAMRAGEHQTCDRIGRALQRKLVDRPDREVGPLARGELPEVVTAENGGAAAGAESNRVARGHRLRAAPAARNEQRVLHLEEEIAALVGRRAVHAEAHAHSGVEQLAYRCDARAQPEV